MLTQSPKPEMDSAALTQNASWYRGDQSRPFENSTKQLSLKISQNADLLDLSQEEIALRNKQWTPESLMKYVQQLNVAADRKPKGEVYERARSFFYSSSDLASRICGIVQFSLPSNSEYQTILAALAIFFKTFSSKQDLELKIVDQINQILAILPTVEYLRSAVTNVYMSDATSGICTEIATYLYRAISYFKKPRLGKLASALLLTFEKNFARHLSAIKAHAETIKTLQGTATLAVGLDTIEKLDQNTKLLFQMLKESQATVASLSGKLSECYNATIQQTNFTAELHLQTVLQSFLPEPYDLRDTLATIDGQRQRLKPSERWENRNLDSDIRDWFTSSSRNRPLLWISGPIKHNRMSFLSPFTADLANILALENDIGLAYILCDTFNGDYPPPDFILRFLTSQLLRAHPKVLMSHATLLPLSRLRPLAQPSPSTIPALFALLGDVLACLKTQPTDWPRLGYFLLIDRIDVVEDVKGCRVLAEFVRALQGLCAAFEDVNVVVTSAVAAGDVEALDKEERMLRAVRAEERPRFGGAMRLA